LHVVPLF